MTGGRKEGRRGGGGRAGERDNAQGVFLFSLLSVAAFPDNAAPCTAVVPVTTHQTASPSLSREA